MTPVTTLEMGLPWERTQPSQTSCHSRGLNLGSIGLGQVSGVWCQLPSPGQCGWKVEVAAGAGQAAPRAKLGRGIAPVLPSGCPELLGLLCLLRAAPTCLHPMYLPSTLALHLALSLPSPSTCPSSSPPSSPGPLPLCPYPCWRVIGSQEWGPWPPSGLRCGLGTVPGDPP